MVEFSRPIIPQIASASGNTSNEPLDALDTACYTGKRYHVAIVRKAGNMKRLVLVLAITLLSLVAISMSGSPRPTSAGVAWPPLQNCPDLNGDGAVSGLDLFAMISSAGSVYSATSVTSDYVYLYDRNGDQSITLLDFLNVLSRLGERCSLIDTQVAKATLATMKYRDWSVAQADGYTVSTQYVPQMGIHVSNSNYTMNFDPTSPIGMIYKDAGSGVPGELIGMWYVVPNDQICAIFSVTGPCQPSDVKPVGFGLTNTDEDSTDLNSVQKSWHTHTNLCFIPNPLSVVEQGPSGSHQACKDLGGIVNFETYAWMIHLYNFIPNPDGRFMMWNNNLP